MEALLHGDDGVNEVKVEEAKARTRGVEGVPFFIVNDTLTVSGAQPTHVFLAAFSRLAQLRDPSKLRPWLFAICRHEVYRRTKSRRRIELMEEPKRLYSNFIHGITEMKVRIPA